MESVVRLPHKKNEGVFLPAEETDALVIYGHQSPYTFVRIFDSIKYYIWLICQDFFAEITETY